MITPYQIVGPTGGDDTAMLNAALASSASRPVMMSFGTYDIRAPLTVPNAGVLLGAAEINAWDYYNGIRPRVFLRANPTTNTFIAGNAILSLGNYAKIQNFGIFGLVAAAPTFRLNGVNILASQFTTVRDVWVNLCFNGFNLAATGSVIGPRFYGGGALYNTNYGILIGSNGGFVSDGVVNDVQIVSNVFAGMLLGDGTSSFQVIGCRIEDQDTGIIIKHASNVSLTGLKGDRNMHFLIIDSSIRIAVTGCQSLVGPTGVSTANATHVAFKISTVQPTGISFSGNTYLGGTATTSDTYNCDAFVSSAFRGYFAEDGTPEDNTNVFADGHTSTILSPMMMHKGP